MYVRSMWYESRVRGNSGFSSASEPERFSRQSSEELRTELEFFSEKFIFSMHNFNIFSHFVDFKKNSRRW